MDAARPAAGTKSSSRQVRQERKEREEQDNNRFTLAIFASLRET
jgi:hypothetical protein